MLTRFRRSGSVRLVSRTLILSLLTLGPSPGRAQSPENPTSATPAAPITACEVYYERKEYLNAARACEASQDLYNAGMARYAEGHDALAVARWEALLAQGGADEAYKADIEARLPEARLQTVVVRVESTAVPEARTVQFLREGHELDALQLAWPAGTGSLEVRLDAVSWTVKVEGGPYEPVVQKISVAAGAPQSVKIETRVLTAPVTLALGPDLARRRGISLTWSGPRSGPPLETTHEPSRQWDLPRGTWQLRAAAQGFLGQQHEVVVEGPQGASLQVELVRDPRERVPVRVAAGLGGTAVALLVGGIVSAWGAAQARSGTLQECRLAEACQPNTMAVGRLSLGVGLLGAAIGATVPVIVAAREAPAKVIRREAIAGAVLSAAGLVGALVERADVKYGYSRGDTAQVLLAAGVLGIGGMILSGALVHMLANRAAGSRHRQVAQGGGASSRRGGVER